MTTTGSTQPNVTTNSGTNSTQAPAQSGGNVTLPDLTAIGPDDVIFSVQYINDYSWPKHLTLSFYADNWEEWSFQVSLLADKLGFTDWLNGTLSRPDKATHPRAHQIWDINDDCFEALLFSHISRSDYRAVASCPTSYAVFEELRKTHERSKMVLLQKAMNIRYRSDVPFSTTIEEIDALFTRIINMGPFDNDQLRAILHINALNDNYENIQSHLMILSEDPSFSSKTIIRHLDQEESLMRRRAEQNPQRNSSNALAARGRKPSNAQPRPTCTNCKKTGHLADFCIRPGGKMAGRSIEDALATQRASSNKAKASGTSTTVNAASADAKATPASTASSFSSAPDTVVINGVTYFAVSSQTSTAEQLDSDDSGSGYAFALSSPAKAACRAAVDRSTHSRALVDSDTDAPPVTSAFGPPFVMRVDGSDLPFIIDYSASNHISSERSDFKNLRAIPPRSIEGFNGSSTNALGIGDIDVPIHRGNKLPLKDVFFVSDCNTRLISVLALKRGGCKDVTLGPRQYTN